MKIIIFLCFLLIIMQININLINRKLTVDWTEKYNASLQKITNRVSVYYGDVYAYNPMKRYIIAKKKTLYTLSDYFALNHEFAHHIDNQNIGVYRGMILITIYRLVFIPIAILMIILSFAGIRLPHCFLYLYEVLLILCVLSKVIYILTYEIRANKHAYEVVKKELSNKFLKQVRRLIYCVVAQQLIITIEIGVLILCGLIVFAN